MSHTNSTTNYGLPQFITTDKPFWLTDINTAFSDIDGAIKTAKDTADNASTNASQAILDAGAASTTANAAKAEADGLIASVSDIFSTSSTYTVGEIVIYNNLLYECITNVTTPGAWTGSANWVRITIEDILARKQNKTDNSLATSNKTVTGAINEVNTNTNNNTSSINALTTAMGGANFEVKILDGNTDVFSKEYTSFCIAVVGRGRGCMFVGSNADIQTIHNTGSDIAPFKVANKNQIRLVNNSSYTSVVIFIYD